MRRRTQKEPKIFEREGYTFKIHAFGFLSANEKLLKYLPTVLKLLPLLSEVGEGTDGDESGETEINLTKLLEGLPQGLLTDVCVDLFDSTEFKETDSEDNYEKLDPSEFESLAECGAVLWEVFQFNYPDFFGKEGGTVLPTSEKSKAKIEKIKSGKKSLVDKFLD